MTLRERLKAVTNNFAWEQDWNIQEYAVHKRDIEYRRGKADAYGDVVHRLDEVIEEFPEEPVGKDKMTLEELAQMLRKIFKFKYLTAEIVIYNTYFCMWDQKPRWNGKYWEAEEDGKKHIITDFLAYEIVKELDLSEYKDENREIDYSKCIVEVRNE